MSDSSTPASASATTPAATPADAPAPLKKCVFPFPVIESTKEKPVEVPADKYASCWGQSAEDGFYPLGMNGQWHGGIHFGQNTGQCFFNQKEGVRCIADGEVIAYRFDSKYPESKYAGYGQKGEFSTGFVLVRHRLQVPKTLIPEGEKQITCVFYSLYMHLQHWEAYEKDKTIARPKFLEAWPVGKGANDPIPDGGDWENWEGKEESGLNLRDNKNKALIGWAPRGTRLGLGQEVSKNWRRITGIEGDVFLRKGIKREYLITDGMVYVKELDPVIRDPKVKDTVYILSEPVEIKAGELVGHLGNYLRFDPEVIQGVKSSPLLHLEVFAGQDLPAFIDKCRKLDDKASDNTKNLLKIGKGAKPVKALPPTTLDLTNGEWLALDPTVSKEGHWVKLLRGQLEVKEINKINRRTWDEDRQCYENGQYFYAALTEDGTDSKSYQEYSGLKTKGNYPKRKLFIPDKSKPVWVTRDLFQNRPKDNGNDIFVVRDTNMKVWSEFPLDKDKNVLQGDVAATLVIDIKKQDNPLVEARATDDKKRRWWQVTYLALLDGRAQVNTGWVCEEGFGKDKVKLCSPWAWPGFDLTWEDPLTPLQWFKRLVSKDYSPNTPLLKHLFTLLDADGNKKLSWQELREGWMQPRLAQMLSRQIIEHKSEWGLSIDEWKKLDKLMKEYRWGNSLSSCYPDTWEEEKKRIGKLRFWDDVGGKHGFPTDIKVWHIHPLALVENFMEVKRHPVILVDGQKVELEFLNYNDGEPIPEEEYTNAAKIIGCEVAVIKAVAQVESGKLGPFFNIAGWDRVPTILFERHQFHKHSKGAYSTEKNRNISHRSQSDSEKEYPEVDGYWHHKYQYQRLLKAYALDKRSALMSASWGRFQMMGFNYTMIPGVSSVEDMVRKYSESEKWHFIGLVAFVKANPGLAKALKNKEWAKAAVAYNGQNALAPKVRYDLKLEAAYNAIK